MKDNRTFWCDYNDFLESDEWQENKRRIIQDRGYCCERCGSTEGIKLHHLNYDQELGSETDDDLMLLCDDCHNDAHKDLECFE